MLCTENPQTGKNIQGEEKKRKKKKKDVSMSHPDLWVLWFLEYWPITCLSLISRGKEDDEKCLPWTHWHFC